MGFKKVIDRQRAVPGKYSVTPVSAGQDIIQDIPANINVEGTRIDADLLNSLQAGLIFEFDSVNSIESGKDIYSIEVLGLISSTAPNDYPLQSGMTFQIKINTTSTQDQVILKINGDEYDVAKVSINGIVALVPGDLMEGMYCNITYNGTLFIVENFSLPMRENTRGITSGLDIRKTEAASVLGAVYGDVFGSALTSITAGRTYYYWDGAKQIYIPYLALTNATNASGFLIPDTTNFYNLSSVFTKSEIDRLIRTKEVTSQTYPNLGDSRFIRIGKICFFTLYLQNTSGFSLNDGHVITAFPTNFFPDNSFLSPRASEFSIQSNFSDSSSNTGRIVFGSTGPQIFGVTGKTILELKGTLTYFNNL